MKSETSNNEYLWYLGYGSNLCYDRFICYIKGGKFRLGGSYTTGCKDQNLPTDNKPLIIPYRLYFAYSANKWDDGGVAFISLESESNEKKQTYGRMWKVTREQFDDIWNQEGKKLYNKKIDLGQDKEGIPIYTFTNNTQLKFVKPSKNYIKTIAIGLRETYHFDDKHISQYLLKKPGIENNLSEEEICNIISENN